MTLITVVALFVNKNMVKTRKKCKNAADRKMVKSLESIPWKNRQWWHALERNAIDSKQKLGLGYKK